MRRTIILVLLILVLIAGVASALYFVGRSDNAPIPPIPTPAPITGTWLHSAPSALTTIMVNAFGGAEIDVNNCQGISVDTLTSIVQGDAFLLDSPQKQVVGSWSGNSLIVKVPGALVGTYQRVSSQQADTAIATFRASCSSVEVVRQ